MPRLAVLLLALVSIAPSLAGTTATSGQQGDLPTEGRRVAGEGRQCLACGGSLDGEAVLLVHRGRRVSLHPGECLEHWRRDREALFARLQPHGALFDEPPAAAGALTSRWFWLGSWVLLGLVTGALAAWLALVRGRTPLHWFFLGLAASVVALGVLALLPRRELQHCPEGVPGGLRKVPRTRQPVPCAGCGSALHPSVASCPSCGATRRPTASSEVART